MKTSSNLKHKVGLGLVILSATSSLFAGSVTTIPHGVGIYISPSGREYFTNSGDDLARRGGLNLNHQNLGNKHHDMGEQTVEQMLPDNASLTSLIKQAKFYFARFFRSQEIVFRNKHHIKIDVKNIDVTARWNRVGIDFHKNSYGPATPTRMYLNLNLNSFLLKVDKVDVKDSLHGFLETIGVDNIAFGTAADSVPLSFRVPVDVLVRGGKFTYTVGAPETNLDQIKLALDFKKPMRLPVMEIFVNGQRARVRLDEIERMLRDKRADLMAGLKKAASAYLATDFAPMVKKAITEPSNNKFKAWESMEPLGTLPCSGAMKMEYKLIPAGLDYKDEHLHFFLNAFVQDPRYSTVPGLDDRQTATIGAQSRTLNKHSFDAAVTLNEGFINQLLQLSDRRGYYDYITTSDGTKYKNVERPKFELAGRLAGDRSIPPAVKLKIQYNVTGIKKYAVNNPLEVEFELKIKLKIVNGKVQIVVDGVNHESVYVARRFAAYEVLWPKVLEAARETLAGMESGLRGMVLSDDIPIPTDIFGFPMRITHAEPDPNGHIVVFMDYDLYGTPAPKRTSACR